MRSPTSDDPPTAVDPERVAAVVERYPVRLAVLFGSHARGTQTRDSDVDVAVAFEGNRSASERLELRIDLVADLVDALGTDDVDVSDLEGIRPEVGASALETGTVLVGDRETVDAMRERFERERGDETREERLDRFDSILDRLEGKV